MGLPAQKDAHETPQTTSQLSNVIWYVKEIEELNIRLTKSVSELHA